MLGVILVATPNPGPSVSKHPQPKSSAAFCSALTNQALQLQAEYLQLFKQHTEALSLAAQIGDYTLANALVGRMAGVEEQTKKIASIAKGSGCR